MMAADESWDTTIQNSMAPPDRLIDAQSCGVANKSKCPKIDRPNGWSNEFHD